MTMNFARVGSVSWPKSSVSRSFAGALVVVLAACGSGDEPTSTSKASGSAVKSAGATLASGAPSASAAPSATAKPPPPPLGSAQARDVATHLSAGRKLAAKKDWKGAIQEYEVALTAAPRDAVLYGELGWAAFQDGDYAKAKDANKIALAHKPTPPQRASILYNVGRVAEAEKDNDAAKKAYAESLGLRDNADVRKHFKDVGGKIEDVAVPFATCAEGYGSIKELCGCLMKNARDLMIDASEGARCVAAGEEGEAASPDLGDPRLSVVHLRNKDDAEDTLVIASKDDSKYRAVAKIGSGWDPTNVQSIQSGEMKDVKGRKIVTIHHTEHDETIEYGLLHFTTNIVSDTLCVLGDASKPTTCPVTVIKENTDGCALVDGLDVSTLSDEQRELSQTCAAPKTEAATYAIGDTGKVTVKYAGKSATGAAIPDAVWVLFSK